MASASFIQLRRVRKGDSRAIHLEGLQMEVDHCLCRAKLVIGDINEEAAKKVADEVRSTGG